MKYCNNCHELCEGEKCQTCRSKKLREVEDGDFCLLVECLQNEGEILKSFLEAEEIPSVLMPSGNGIRTVFGLNLENYKVFVPYAFWDKANDILDGMADFGDEEDA